MGKKAPIQKPQDGFDEQFGERSEEHQQRREAGQASGLPATLLLSHRPILVRDDEARLQRRVRDCRRPPWWQDYRQLDRTHQQGRRHHATLRHWSQGLRKVGKQPPALQAVRQNCCDYFRWYHGSRRSQEEAPRWQDCWILLLKTITVMIHNQLVVKIYTPKMHTLTLFAQTLQVLFDCKRCNWKTFEWLA